MMVMESKRRFLVVVDDSEEMENALHYASRRVRHSGGELVLLYIGDEVAFQHWQGLEQMMQQELMETANAKLQQAAIKARKIMGSLPEMVVRQGARAETLIRYVKEDKSIAVVVLAASTSGSGPGPILSYLFGKNAPILPVPLTIVPGNLSLEAIDKIS